MIQQDVQKHIITETTVEFGTDIKSSGSLILDGLAAAPAALEHFGKIFILASDGKPYCRAGDGTIYNLGMIGDAPFVFKDAIAVATDFPLVADVQTGWLYRITADVVDNGGATYTNTGLNFNAGDEIAWNGTTWSDLGTSVAMVAVVATPYVVADAARVIAVDTATIAATTTVTLPTAVGRNGKRLVITDATGSAATYPILVTPNGAETINGVNAAIAIRRAYGTVEILSNGTNWVTLQNEVAIVDANVLATMPGVAFQTLASKVSAALNGTSTKYFIPEKIVCIATAAGAGTQNGDAEIKVGTSDGGTQITVAHPAKISVNHGVATILLEGDFAPIAGNATIWVEVTKADTDITANLTVTVQLIGRQV